MPGWGRNSQKGVWRKTGLYGKVREIGSGELELKMSVLKDK